MRGEADVLVGRCLAYGEAITYWPLRGVIGEAGGDSYETILGLLAGTAHAEAVARRVAGAIGFLDASIRSRRSAGPCAGSSRLSHASDPSSSASTISTGPTPRSSISSTTSSRRARPAA